MLSLVSSLIKILADNPSLIPADSSETRPTGDSDRNVQSLLSGVNCSGSEERLADCDHDGVDLGHTVACDRAFVRCLHKIMVTTGKIH